MLMIMRLRTLWASRLNPARTHIYPKVAAGGIIEIGRILRDSMDLQRHLPFSDDENSENP
jgi:hypothetical protein